MSCNNTRRGASTSTVNRKTTCNQYNDNYINILYYVQHRERLRHIQRVSTTKGYIGQVKSLRLHKTRELKNCESCEFVVR